MDCGIPIVPCVSLGSFIQGFVRVFAGVSCDAHGGSGDWSTEDRQLRDVLHEPSWDPTHRLFHGG